MLQYALRRLVWAIPSLAVLTLVLFGLLWHGLSPVDFVKQAGALEGGATPMYFNLHPRDVRSQALWALRRVADNDQKTADIASQRLVHLGGAAFPAVLAKMDSLGPAQRGRVAIALGPVAIRMGLATPESFANPTDAVVFWARFWQERSADFRASVVRRAVDRLLLRYSGVRRAELIELDTFALPGILGRLHEPVDSADADRMSRLIDVAAHVSGRDDLLQPGSSVAQAQACVRRWKQWWIDARSDYSPISGPSRLAAMLMETRYGRWAYSAASLGLGVNADGSSVFERLRQHGPFTLLTSFLGVIAAFLISLGLGVIDTGATLSPLARRGLGVGTAILCAIPPVAWGLAFGWPSFACYAGEAAIIMVVLSALPSTARQQHLVRLDSLFDDCVRTARAKGAGPWRIAFVHYGRLGAATLIALFGSELPMALTAACVAEQVLGIHALGRDLVAAVRGHDVAFLMAFGVCSSVLGSVSLLANDLISALIDVRAGGMGRRRRAA